MPNEISAKNNQELNEGKKGFIPSQLHALANAALSAQRLAKLALGEVTHNVEINGNLFNQQDLEYIFQLSEIIQDSGEIGTFNLGNLKITINSLNSYEKDLIKI